MKRCIIIVALILFLLTGCSENAADTFTAKSQNDITFGEDLTSTETISLSDNFDVTYKFDFSTTEYKIKNAQLWLHLDLGDHNLAVAMTGKREAQILTEAGTVQPLEIVTKKEGLSELENSIYRAGHGLVTSMSDRAGTQYRLTVQLCRYGNKIYCQVYQPAFQLLSLSTQAVICDFLYISPIDISGNVDLSFSGEAISLTNIEYVNYPTLSSDPEASIWPDVEMSDGSKTGGWFNILIFVVVLAVCCLLAWAAYSWSFHLELDEMNISFRRCLLLVFSTVIAVSGLVYFINPYFENFLTRKFKALTMTGYDAPVADSCRWLIYVPAVLCAIVVLIICISTLMKAHKTGRSGSVLLGVFAIGCLYLPLAYLLFIIAFEILKAVAAILVVIVIVALFATAASSSNTKPTYETATISDGYGNSKNVRIARYDDRNIYLTDTDGTKKLVPDGYGGYKDDNGNQYEIE